MSVILVYSKKEKQRGRLIQTMIHYYVFDMIHCVKRTLLYENPKGIQKCSKCKHKPKYTMQVDDYVCYKNVKGIYSVKGMYIQTTVYNKKAL